MNTVKLIGTVTREPKTGGQGDRAYAFLSIRTEEEKPCIVDVAAFGEAAAQAGRVAVGDAVTITGRIGVKEDKKLSEAAGRKVWLMQVVAESVAGNGEAEEF